MIKNCTYFLHNGSIGDVWASLPAMKEYNRVSGKKVVLCLENGQKAEYYDGAVHPTKNSKGEQVMLNIPMINMMIPLLKAQPFIADAKIWEKEPIHIDLNKIRETFVNMPNGCISRWYFYVMPDLACDLSTKWLTVPDSKKDLAKNKIIISRTERYLNLNTDYSFLKRFQKDILFVGTKLEHIIFNGRFGLRIKRLVVKDFLELAQAIKQSRFHISNQTSAFQLSQGLKHPRIVELCKYAPNVIPVGEYAYDFYAQEGLEYYFHKLNGTLPEYIKQVTNKQYKIKKGPEIQANKIPNKK